MCKKICLELPYSWRKSIKFFFENDIFESVKIERGKLDRLCQYTLYCCYLSIDYIFLPLFFCLPFEKWIFLTTAGTVVGPALPWWKWQMLTNMLSQQNVAGPFEIMYYAGIKVSLT